MDDATFLNRFRDRTLDPAHFNHEAHVRAAWLYLTSMSTEEAIARFSADIRSFAEGLGAHGKFHRTITEALMRLFASHLVQERHLTWQQLIETHPVVVNDALGLLGRFYTNQRLHSEQARKRFVKPDIAPLPDIG